MATNKYLGISKAWTVHSTRLSFLPMNENVHQSTTDQQIRDGEKMVAGRFLVFSFFLTKGILLSFVFLYLHFLCLRNSIDWPILFSVTLLVLIKEQSRKVTQVKATDTSFSCEDSIIFQLVEFSYDGYAHTQFPIQ